MRKTENNGAVAKSLEGSCSTAAISSAFSRNLIFTDMFFRMKRNLVKMIQIFLIMKKCQ